MDVPLASLAIADAQFILGLELHQCQPLSVTINAGGLMDVIRTGRAVVDAIDRPLAARALYDDAAFQQLREKCRMALVEAQAGRPLAIIRAEPIKCLVAAIIWVTLHQPSPALMHQRRAIANCMLTDKRVVVQIASTVGNRYIMAIDSKPRNITSLLAAMSPVEINPTIH